MTRQGAGTRYSVQNSIPEGGIRSTAQAGDPVQRVQGKVRRVNGSRKVPAARD